MAWLAICRDRADVEGTRLRREHRDAHFRYIESILDRLLIAGPLAPPGSAVHHASFFVYDVDSEQEARDLLEQDPYFAAGIYGEIRFEPFWPAAGRWLPGKIW